jgi:hypothetical protein
VPLPYIFSMFFITNISLFLAKTDFKHSPRFDTTFVGKSLLTCDVSNNAAGLGPACEVTLRDDCILLLTSTLYYNYGMCGLKWIYMVQDRDKRRVVTNTATELRVE